MTLSGFASISEREPAKQSHTFGFSFEVPSEVEAPKPSEVEVHSKQDEAVSFSEQVHPEPEFMVWSHKQSKRIKSEALLFGSVEPTKSNSSESNQHILRDVKRKLRGFKA